MTNKRDGRNAYLGIVGTSTTLGSEFGDNEMVSTAISGAGAATGWWRGAATVANVGDKEPAISGELRVESHAHHPTKHAVIMVEVNSIREVEEQLRPPCAAAVVDPQGSCSSGSRPSGHRG